MSEKGPRTRWVAYAACALCVAVALFALTWAEDQDDAGDQADETVLEQAGEAVREGMRALGSGTVSSSGERFLDDLESSSTDTESGVGGVMWKEEGDLVDPASEVLRSYATQPTAMLETSGYLDIKGNVWGAIVLDTRGWVDIIYVTTSDDASETVVRIARMTGGEREEE